MKDKIKKLAKKIANPGDLVKANIYSNPIKNIGQVMKIEMAKKIAGKKDGGLIDAIEKVKAKEMELGGDVAKPKSRPKSLKADKTESLDKEFSKKVAKTNKKNMANVKKDAVPPKFKGFSKLPEKVQQKIDPNLASKYEMGGKVEEYGAGGNVKGGKMGCRGMGAALRGGGFSIR
jgi:hypothetical protein